MKTATKTIGISRGLTNDYNVRRRPTPRTSRRDAEGFLSQPYGRYELREKRSKRTAATRTLARQKRATRFDEPIITRQNLKKCALYLLAALTLSGILPMAVAGFQTWLMDVYGNLAFLACLGADAAVIYGLVHHDR